MAQLVIDSGCAMTRAALIEDDEVGRIWFGPARGDETHCGHALIGHIYRGRVQSLSREMKSGYVQLPGDMVGYIDLKADDPVPSIGALVEVEVTHMARFGKLPRVRLKKNLVDAKENNDPASLNPTQDPLLDAFDWLTDGMTGALGDCVFTSGIAKAGFEKLKLNNPSLALATHCRFEPSCFDDICRDLDEFFSPSLTLPSGGVITIDQSEALTAIDIDSAAMGAPSRNRLNEKLNREALISIIRQLQLRMIGGQIAIDFLPMPKPVQSKFDSWLRGQMKALPGFGRAGWTPSGLFCFSLPRNKPSLLEQFTRPSAGGVIKARAFTPDFTLRHGLSELEVRLRAQPGQKFELLISSDIDEIYKANPQWGERVEENYGARITLHMDKDLKNNSVVFNEKF